ncbi:MAG: hypothetical protein G3M78_08275 [Candidatus Nitrohelix vancouverensis]|uniref:Uncharacterized protein n=1 Tax=Candidatus Nitrohelix vancouverensis TaxID=2705534 RepID=A0A7T0C2K3_9BACT|nr:MAG: hypothetical protein G3M78_08275 [Candidatus Nitrohelix vancouverensis]
MPRVKITKEKLIEDVQARTFSDVANDPEQPFDAILDFFNDEARQVRMEDSEIHHDRPPLAGVVRELESYPRIDRALSGANNQKSKRLRQAIGVVVRMIMEARGWQKTGRKGSLGVGKSKDPAEPGFNRGGLALWFVRAERYVLAEGMPYQSVRERCKNLDAPTPQNTQQELNENS